MKKFLFILFALLLISNANAQFKRSAVDPPKKPQPLLVQPKTGIKEAVLKQQPGSFIKKEGQRANTPTAFYHRPAGAFTGVFLEQDGDEQVWMLYSPCMFVKPYADYSFKGIANNVSSTANYYWWYYNKDYPDGNEYIGKDFTIRYDEYDVNLVPEFDIEENDNWYTYMMGTYATDNDGNQSFEPSYVFPETQTNTVIEGYKVLLTSKTFSYTGLFGDVEYTWMTYYNSDLQPYGDNQYAWWFGKNAGSTNGYRLDGIAQAFEKPEHPYLLKGIKAYADYLSVSADVNLSCKVYRLDGIPAYNESTTVSLPETPGELIAWGVAKLTPSSGGLISFELYWQDDEDPNLTYEYDPTIDFPILVVIDGYNDTDKANLTDIAFPTCYDINVDEGFGELAYVKYATTDANGDLSSPYQWRGLYNLWSQKIMTGFMVFVDIELPFIVFSHDDEPGFYQFSEEGGPLMRYYDGTTINGIEFKSSVESDSDNWWLTCNADYDNLPDWLHIELSDEAQDGEFSGKVIAAVTADPLPIGLAYRSATIRFNAPGAYIDYTFAQAASPYTVAGVPASVFGTEWDAANRSNNMTLGNDDIYRLYKTNVWIDANENVEFKVAKDYWWDNSWPEDNMVISVDESGYYNITFTFNIVTKEVGYQIEQSETAKPTITTEETDDAVTITATGDGEVKLYKDGVEVENPCTIARTNVDQQFTFTATAQEEGMLISETATAIITVPAQMDMSGDIVFIAGIDNGTGSTTAGQFSIEKQGVTIEVTNGLANSSHYRFYKGQTVTITSTVGNISKVVFDCIAEDDAQYGPGGFTVEDGEYTYSGKVGTWIGSAQSVVFTASNYQVRASKVTVTIGDESKTITVCDGTDKNDRVPVYGYYYDAEGGISQMIYPADMLTAMQGGKITQLKFYPTAGLNFGGGLLQLSLRLIEEDGYTESVAFTGATAVANITPETGMTELVFELDEPFEYTGGNLLVETLVNEPGSYGRNDFWGVNTDNYASFYNYSSIASKISFLPKATFTYVEGSGTVQEQTATPTISTEKTNDAVIVTATGDGEVELYKDGVEVENPCTIARTSTEQRFTFTATAHEEGKLISETATLAVTVPAKQAPEDDKTTGEYNILPDGNPRMAGQGVQDHLFVRDMNGSQTVDNTVNFYDNNEQLVWIWLDDDQIYMNESVQSLTPIAYNSAGDLYNEITYNSLQCDIYLPSGFSLTQIIDNNGQQINFAQGDRLPSTSNLIWAKKNEIKTIDGIQYDVYSLIIYNVNNYGSHFSSKNATMYQSRGALKKDDAPLFGLGLTYDGVSASSYQPGDMIIANQVFTTREASVAEWGANESMFYYATGGNNMAQLFNLYNRVKLVVDGQIPEQTAAPVINGTIDHVTGTYTIALSPGEDNSVIYYRYINYSDDEWSEWMEYVNPIQFTEQGMYRIEAYAVAPGKQSSVHVYYDFMNSGPVYTTTPTITAEETDNAVIVTATGDGEVKLYLDGVEVENPYVIPKQEQTMTYNFTATAQKEGLHISNEASLTVTVPGYGSGITVYVKADRAPHLFSWVPDGNGSWINPLGDWPGSVMSNIMTVNRVQYYTYTFDPFPSVNIILNNGSGGFGNQTGDFVNITEDAYFVYNGGGLAYGVIPPTVYGNPTGEYAFYVNTDHWSKVNAVLDGVSYPMTLVGTDGAGYEVYKWENNMITAPSTITFNDGAGHQVVDASGHVYSSDYVKGGYYIYTFFASKQYASLDMPTVITYEGEDQRPVLEDCAITLKSSNEVWNSYNDVSFDITGTYFNPAARQGRVLYSVDGGEWVEFTSLLNSEQRFTQNVTLSFNPDVTRHTIRLAAQDLSGAYSAIVTVLEVTDAKALLCYDLPELEYTGEPLTFEPWIYDPYSYQQLTLGEDYTVSFSNNVNVGPASMNVQAIYPAYIGETTFTYAIIPHPISGEAYVVGGPFYYNGNAFTPAVVVIDDLLGELTPGEDYTVTYIDNVEIGEAIALVEGIGRCTGEIAVPFEILDPPMNERDWNIIKRFYSQYQSDQFVWNVDDPVSAKYNSGLTVENERVTGIELPEQGLEGGFPTMLLSLDELRTLDLSYNNLSGDAASDMAQYAAAEGITATGLQNLFINNNEFTGNVGQMAALFGNLTNLNVSANHFDKVYPMVNPGVNLSLSEQLLEMDADITPGIESLITSIPTICLYDHAAQTFLTSLSAQLTDQAQSPVWNMDLSFNNGAFNMYTSSPYRGLNGQILDGYTWLNSSWYNEQLLKVKFIFAPGDANINGPVDITDLQAMVNYIFGEYNRPFNYTAANLNNDNTVNVQDVVGEANLLLSMDLTMGTSGPGRAPVLETTTPQASLYWQDGVLYLNTSVPVAALDIVNDVNGDIKWNVANRGMVVKTARGTQGEHTVIYSLGDAVIPPGLTAIATTTSHGATVVAAKLSDTDAELVKIKLNDGLTRLTDVPTDGNVQCQLDGNSLIINSGNPLEDVNIGIYTIDGKVIADKHLSHLDSGQTRISMSDFAYSNGYLIIVVRNGRQVIATQKLTQIK